MKNLITIVALLVTVQGFCQGQLQKETNTMLNFTSGKIMQLAESLPAEKYDWSPMEGVRSFAGVFGHIISANYFFATKLGAELPEGVNLQTVEQDMDTKEEITAELKKSYDLIMKAISEAKDEDLATKVEYPFPGEFTNMSSILIAFSHANEHLGQLIAYARMNEITPPWSK